MIQPAPIQQLRSALDRITGNTRRATVPALPVGVAEIDGVLPARGLLRGGVHEFVGDLATCTGFVAALLGRDPSVQQVLWITPSADLYAAGLHQLGLGHRRLTVAWASRQDDRLWAAEEGLKELGYGAVVAELPSLDLTEGRRLQLAAEASGSICILLRRDRQPSPALTRWQVHPARGLGDGLPGWRVTLERCRGSEVTGTWHVRFDHAALCFRLAAPLANRQIEGAAA